MLQPRRARAQGCRAFPGQPDHAASPHPPPKWSFLPRFPDLSYAGEVICSLRDPLLPAAGSALSPGIAREAEPPAAGAHGDAELQDALGQGNITHRGEMGGCVRPALLQLGFERASLPLGRGLKGLRSNDEWSLAIRVCKYLHAYRNQRAPGSSCAVHPGSVPRRVPRGLGVSLGAKPSPPLFARVSGRAQW